MAPAQPIIAAALLLALSSPALGGTRPFKVEPDNPLLTLRALIANATCIRDNQCRSLAIGASACGGPERYLAWSTLHTDETALQTAAAAYAVDRLSLMRRGAGYSTCRPVVDPGAQCTPAASSIGPGLCELRRANPAGVAAPDR